MNTEKDNMTDVVETISSQNTENKPSNNGQVTNENGDLVTLGNDHVINKMVDKIAKILKIK